MKNKVLLDTNILIYALDGDSDYHLSAWEILNNDYYDFYLSTKNISEFIAVVTRRLNPLLNIEDTLSIIKKARQDYTVIYPTHSSLDQLLILSEKYKVKGLRIYDFEIISLALANDIHKIATFNYKDFNRIEEIEVIQS